MKVIVLKASDWDYREVKEIKTFEDLKAIDNRIIIDFNVDKEMYGTDIDAKVTIYDYYVE